jgi:glycerophosphoryl diester phosphodiesterase
MNPIVIGHRGVAAEAPENSLASVELALKLGAGALELDVRRSRDGVLVLIHDPDLRRTSDRSGEVAALDLGEIQQADLSAASDPHIPRWPVPLRVPTLEQIFERFPDVEITVDVKDPAASRHVVDLVAQFGRTSNTILYVEQGVDTRAFKEYPGRRATSVSQAVRLATTPEWLQDSPEREVPEVVHTPLRSGDVSLVDHEFVTRIHDSGRTIQVWTVDDVPTMEWLAECGVDGIITNDVRRAAARFGSGDVTEECT